MGTKLCNLHIYNPDRKDYSVETGYSVARIAEGWDTVYENEPNLNFNKLAKMARELSKELDTPVISVNYFDDDVFELNVTIEGKKAAYYCVNFDRNFSKKVPVMVDALRLDDKAAKAFRYLLKKEMDAPKAINSISALCGLPLFSDMFLYKEMPDNLIPDKEAVLKDIQNEKARNKITSVKAELLEEIPGAVVFYYNSPSPSDKYGGIIRTVEPGEGEPDYGRVSCYQITEGPVPYLKKVHDYYIPIHEYTKMPKNTNIWINVNESVRGDFRDLVFLEPPCLCHYFSSNEKEIEKVGKFGIIPEEKLSKSSYEFGEFSFAIDGSKLPISLDSINAQLPDKKYFIDKRTIGGKQVLVIGASRYVHVFDYDLKRLQSFSISGKCVSWFFDSDDNLYVVTSSMLHGCENRGMEPSDRVRLYKMHISV